MSGSGRAAPTKIPPSYSTRVFVESGPRGYPRFPRGSRRFTRRQARGDGGRLQRFVFVLQILELHEMPYANLLRDPPFEN